MRAWLLAALLFAAALPSRAQHTWLHGREYLQGDSGWVRLNEDGTQSPVRFGEEREVGNERYTRVDSVLVWLDNYNEWWPVREDEFTVRVKPLMKPEAVQQFARKLGCSSVHLVQNGETDEGEHQAVLDTLPMVYSPEYLDIIVPRLAAGGTYLIQVGKGVPLLNTMEAFLNNPDVLEILPSFEGFE